MKSDYVMLTGRFLRLYTVATAWTVGGAGLFLFVGRPSLLPAMMILAGLGLAVLALRSAGSTAGTYPKRRIASYIITFAGLLTLAVGLVVFSKGILLAIWLAYLLIFLGLSAATISEFRSANSNAIHE